ncbi:hypothetical protein AB835_14900 [Candidatus Endobugula sertula]|uniref:Pentapeptide repeat-containing protein n=1 Tax=Candidatus Endobugula sertula TaxID=62101 RepID=A0A1D2QL64_9GAMM|nr:hypothetical protein AB835_14900 [Candidatus Endobugula sertula]
MSSFDENTSEYISKTFNKLDLSFRELKDIEFDSCKFVNCDFNESIFYKCKLIDCEFEKCNLSLIKLNYTRLLDVFFEDCKIIGVDWTKVDWPNIIPSSPVKFSKCIINDSSFFGLNLKEIMIEECKAHNVDFREGDFRKGSFDYSDLSNSLFNNTNISSASFAEASNYDIDINYNKLTNAKFTKHEATRLLTSLNIQLLD